MDAVLSSVTNIFPSYRKEVEIPLIPQEVNMLVSILANGVTEVDLSKMMVTDETIQLLSQSRAAATVQKLDLSNARITDKSAEALLRFPSLLELNLSTCYLITLSSIECLARHPSLTSLAVKSCRRFKDEPAFLRLILHPANFKRLISLEATLELNFDEEELLLMLAARPNRTDFIRFQILHPMVNIEGYPNAWRFQELLPNLEHFVLKPANLFGGPLPLHLRSVSLPRFNGTPGEWEPLLPISSTLESLSSSNANFGETSMFPPLPRLKSLHLSTTQAQFFGGFSQPVALPQGRKVLEGLASAAPLLEHLMLPDLSWTSEDVEFTLKHFTCLKSLKMGGFKFKPSAIEVSHPALEKVPKRVDLANVSIARYGYLPAARIISNAWILPEDIAVAAHILQGGSRTLPSLEAASFEAFHVQGEERAQQEAVRLFCSALMSKHASHLASLNLRGTDFMSDTLSRLDISKFIRLTELDLNVYGVTEENLKSYLRELQWLRKLRFYGRGPEGSPLLLNSWDWLLHPRLSNLHLAAVECNQAIRLSGDMLPCLSSANFDFRGFPALTMLDLPTIANIKLSRFTRYGTTIEVKNCPNLTDAVFGNVSIHTLTIADCPNLYSMEGFLIPAGFKNGQSPSDFVKLGSAVPPPTLNMEGDWIRVSSSKF
eukprot:TRINITY_DN590_c0_g1_i1.p1 TRINITY_DN590_c0_g1~~TRINITY_DN590_c0_g1_i1.p1  ORF type:complete len:752 (+),score=80.50 TRINITY_DN590_c0_g1_i1:280-2256(+)